MKRSLVDSKSVRVKWSIVWILVALAIGVGVASYVLFPHEPVFQGTRLSEWLEAYGPPTEKNYRELTQKRLAADEAVRQIGTNAIPHLLNLARTRLSAVQSKIIESSLPGVLGLLEAKKRWVRESLENPQSALLGFKALGPDAAPAIGDLMELLQHSDSRNSRRCAALSLGYIGPAAQGAVPLLLQGYKDRDKMVREACAEALNNICWDEEKLQYREGSIAVLVPGFIKLLSDPQTDALLVIRELAAIGAEAQPAISAILPYLKNEDFQVRSEAASALKSIAPKAPTKGAVE